MSLPPVRLAFMSGHHQDNALMNPCHIPSRLATRDVSLGTATKCPTTSTEKTSSQWNYQLTPVSRQSEPTAALRPAGRAQPGRTTVAPIFTDSLTIAIKTTISEEMGLNNDVMSKSDRRNETVWFFYFLQSVLEMISKTNRVWAGESLGPIQTSKKVTWQWSALKKCSWTWGRSLDPRCGVSPERLNICWQAVHLDAFPTWNNWSHQAKNLFCNPVVTLKDH